MSELSFSYNENPENLAQPHYIENADFVLANIDLDNSFCDHYANQWAEWALSIRQHNSFFVCVPVNQQ